MAATDTSIRSSCHCGAITVTVPRLPEYINVCQCTICRRYGAAWGYYHPNEVKIEMKPNAVTKQYIWGDRYLSFNFCDNCGCVYVQQISAPPNRRLMPCPVDAIGGPLDLRLLTMENTKWASTQTISIPTS